MSVPPLQLSDEYVKVFASGEFQEAFMNNFIKHYGQELNDGVVGSTIRKNVPAIAHVDLYMLEPFTFREMNQMNFALLNYTRVPRRRRRGRESKFQLTVFIGLTGHYPADFVEQRGLRVDMSAMVYDEMEKQERMEVEEGDEDWISENEIKKNIYAKYFGANRVRRFYHVLVFDLNLETFGDDEYRMLWDLASVQEKLYFYGYAITTEDVRNAIEKIGDSRRFRTAWAMSQHSRLGAESRVRVLPLDVLIGIARYVDTGSFQTVPERAHRLVVQRPLLERPPVHGIGRVGSGGGIGRENPVEERMPIVATVPIPLFDPFP